MRILALSDIESDYYYKYFDKEKLEGIDLILSCGDLPAHYLSFIATWAKAPLLYVRGNHDDSFDVNPPEGCVCIEDRVYSHNGINIMGLGGTPPYKRGRNLYTEKDMRYRVMKMAPSLILKKRVDILLTHSPALNINDGDDYAHKGYKTFIDIMDYFSPKYFIHGHMHISYSHKIPRYHTYNNTTIINAYQHVCFDF